MPAGVMDRHPAGGPIARSVAVAIATIAWIAGAAVGVIRPGAVRSSCSISCAAMYPSVDACNASGCQRAPNSGISTVKG